VWPPAPPPYFNAFAGALLARHARGNGELQSDMYDAARSDEIGDADNGWNKK
jgi:hypothetical protein